MVFLSMVMRGQTEYYLVNHNAKEDIKLEQLHEGGQFKKDASLKLIAIQKNLIFSL